ncbi:MAG: hypothetical protein QNJ97_24230 [Myxococcota bacterium]|nr:hypothetical protein [Myxococcota bacterium]
MQNFIRTYLVLWLVLVFIGCDTSSADEEDDTDSESSTDSGTEDTVLNNRCALEDRLGGFEVTVLADYSSVQGIVNNGVLPASITTNELEQGGCILWKKHNLVCDPPCLAEETCDFDGTCIPFPLGQDLGTVTIDGLEKEIAMEPRAPGNNYFDTELPHPIFDISSRDIQLKTTTGYLDEITLHGAGSPAIQPQQSELVVIPGQDLAIQWDLPPQDTRTVVIFALNIDQHGSTPITLKCEFEDNGEGLVPAAIIDALIDAGVTGFPSGRLSRGTVDAVQVAHGCVEFAVRSHKAIDINVSGYIPCTGPGTCPEGMTCNLETYLCE